MTDFAFPSASGQPLAAPDHRAEHEMLATKLGDGGGAPTTVGHVLTVTGAGASAWAVPAVTQAELDAVAAEAQPLDADLTAIADLTTTAFGRGLLELANAAALLAAAAAAPNSVDYLVGTASGSLTGEIAVGTTPGGELGGTWASPTVDSVHSGSAHHAQVHGAADHTDVTRTLWLDAKSAGLDASSLTTIGSGSDLTPVVALADAATQGAYWAFQVPSDWSSGVITVQPVWSPGSTDASAHAVVWNALSLTMAAGVTATAAGTSVSQVGASAARTAGVLVYDTAWSTTLTPAAAGDLFRVNVRRLGANGSDTYVGIVHLLGVIVSYTATG